ncbi:sugar phosphate isomerase/epimerase family protein [Aureimonas phyllosphaerae]|uniref:Xylose isomerase n=1 Tax=Aureimonas phyllosphaerae TaxID=1166078 RepID=A0A7W6FX49_9HYPH|nr:sugar phosphate isomerase/epimerase family protein [Aureimonas phyllosphaerae]MBB3937727.1 xylose isomerase [Aureimonas phyllosphaerae]MBB3961738.1 xylose isomerase [Aureimonas phyllosphaerae]SFF45495.1 xylose isomerase [Aureimonas phyllosphaerae]
MSLSRFATRLNSFGSAPHLYWPDLSGKPTFMQMAERAATAKGLTDVDLNFPDHVKDDPASVGRRIRDLGLSVNGLAMRYYTNPAFKLGAFTNPDKAVRREAIDMTKRGVDAARAMSADLMTLWLGQDGFDYNFQLDYAEAWDLEIAGIREIAEHDPACQISIEYKPDEPRAHALLRDCATTLLAIGEIGAPNLGVTLDFAHALYAGEQPAYAAALIHRRSKLLGVHLNDGYAKRDDGLMVGAVHLRSTLELLRQIRRDGYRGALYFDTFPDASGLDPVAECETNIETVQRLLGVADRLDADNRLGEAQSRQDGVASQSIVNAAMIAAA